MPLFTKESLESLRSRINLVELLSSYIELKPAGSAYKGRCPFHDEKTPSFIVYKGDTSYHCFGCGAHGDGVGFLMNYLKLTFSEAVENLAQRFGVHLEIMETSQLKTQIGESKNHLKEILELANRFYQFCLLHTPEGQEALQYLYRRGIDLDFIRQFQIGWAPSRSCSLIPYMRAQQIKESTLLECGLASSGRDGRIRDFFSERITFPIHNAMGSVIGFSARKIREEVFGGKYINTSETPLFKKSKVLFGLHHCRRRIAKGRKAIIVEGQLDALRMIYAGLNLTVAALGTAFGEDHAMELIQLGVTSVYLAFDGDNAGWEAATKVGHVFQKKGIEVFVVAMPKGQDPDTFLSEHGPTEMVNLLSEKQDYLTFLVKHLSKQYDQTSPAAKNELVKVIKSKIKEWEHPLMVHESLRKISRLLEVPLDTLGISHGVSPQVYAKKEGSLNPIGLKVNPHRILEGDLLRWLLLMGDSYPHFIKLTQKYLKPEHFCIPVCRKIYEIYNKTKEEGKAIDLLTITLELNDTEGQQFVEELLQRKVNKDRAEQQFIETLQKVLEKHWLQQREELKAKIHSRQYGEEEILELVRQFDIITKNRPVISKDE
ncbi:MAG: dnaG [Chlamydiales bacterium]|jgi:DNA primase|nr:dnaG [Chlamydiales bacterium]